MIRRTDAFVIINQDELDKLVRDFLIIASLSDRDNKEEFLSEMNASLSINGEDEDWFNVLRVITDSSGPEIVILRCATDDGFRYVHAARYAVWRAPKAWEVTQELFHGSGDRSDELELLRIVTRI